MDFQAHPYIFFIRLTSLQIGIDRTDLRKAFIQLTLEFLTKQVSVIFSHQFVSNAFEAVLSSGYHYYLQKFEAYDAKGNVVAGDKKKEVKYIESFLSLHFCNRGIRRKL